MTTIKLMSLCWVLLWLSSCHPFRDSHPADLPGAHSFTIAVDTAAILPVSQLVDHFRIIRLQSPPDHIIGEIGKICATADHHFYILDRITSVIDVFDSSGRFLFDINRYGFGKGRCKSISDFAIDRSSNTLGIVDPLQSKFLRLDLQGNLLKEQPIVAITDVVKFAFLADGSIVFSRGNPPDRDNMQYSLQVTTADLRFRHRLLKYDETGNDALSALYPFQHSDGATFYLPVYQNVIVRVDSAGVYPAYRLDFGKKWMTPAFIHRESHADDFHSISNDLSLSDYVYFINYSITAANFLVYYTYKDVPCLTVFDRTTMKQIHTRLTSDFDVLGFGAANSNILDDSLYIAYISDLHRLRRLTDKKYSSLFSDMAADSSRQNPVLLLTSFKKIP